LGKCEEKRRKQQHEAYIPLFAFITTLPNFLSAASGMEFDSITFGKAGRTGPHAEGLRKVVESSKNKRRRTATPEPVICTLAERLKENHRLFSVVF
jgi:hypothetical protein